MNSQSEGRTPPIIAAQSGFRCAMVSARSRSVPASVRDFEVDFEPIIAWAITPAMSIGGEQLTDAYVQGVTPRGLALEDHFVVHLDGTWSNWERNYRDRDEALQELVDAAQADAAARKALGA